MKFFAAALSSVLLVGGVAAQKASYRYIDQKAPYSNCGPAAAPFLRAVNLPKLGQQFHVEFPGAFRNFFQGQSATLALGARPLTLNVPAFNGYLYVDPVFFDYAPLKPKGQFHRVTYQIPNNSALLGARFYHQVLLWQYDAATKFTRYCLSRGGAGVVGR